jgi:hypothetical protein
MWDGANKAKAENYATYSRLVPSMEADEEAPSAAEWPGCERAHQMTGIAPECPTGRLTRTLKTANPHETGMLGKATGPISCPWSQYGGPLWVIHLGAFRQVPIVIDYFATPEYPVEVFHSAYWSRCSILSKVTSFGGEPHI